MAERLVVDIVVSMPFAENSYIVHVEGKRACFVIDPGFEPDEILEVIEAKGLELEAILVTHGHADHIAGCARMKEAHPSVPLIIGANEARMLTDPFMNLSALTGTPVTSPPADILVHEGQTIEALGLSWEVREIPGHSPGHVVFVWRSGTPPVVFGGDVLFQGSVGRVDFPGGDGRLLLEGIRTKLYDLPDETIIYPGHGDFTTVEAEKATNPYTRPGSSLF